MEHLILIVVQVVVGIGLIALILIQHGKGADMGASFGSGASQTVFGSSGSGNFLTRATAILATAFFAASLGLAYVQKIKIEEAGQVSFPTPAAETVRDEDLPAVSVDSVEEAASEQEGDLPQVDVQMNTSEQAPEQMDGAATETAPESAPTEVENGTPSTN